ncbi:hypothetical protein CR513_27047, partial [Mucuna pruriens]
MSLDRPRQLRQYFILVNIPKTRIITSKLNECSRTIYGFAREWVPIKGVIELETIFGENSGAKSIPVLCTVVDAEASYNIIMGRPTLNRLGAVVSTLHLCMKLPVGQRVGSPPRPVHSVVNVLDLDLDPWCRYEHERPHPTEDLKEIQVGPSTTHKTKIGVALEWEEEAHLTHFFKDNSDVFAWTTDDMPNIDLRLMCQNLSVSPRAKPVLSRRSISRERRNEGRPEKKRINCWQPVS